MSNSSQIIFSSEVQFTLYLIPNIFAIICSTYSLSVYLFNRKLLKSLNNQIIFILLILSLVFELTNIPWNLYYFLYGTSLSKTKVFALIWTYIDVAVYTTHVVVFAWATIQRHILVFYSNLVSTTTKRLIFHYFPLVILLIYCFIWFYFIIANPFCENIYNYSVIRGISSFCSYNNNSNLPKYNLIVHQLIPTVIILVFSISLLIRILIEKHRLYRSINWRKQRKLTIELLSISLVYFLFNIPWSTIYLAHYFGLPRTIGSEFRLYATFFGNYLLLSFSIIICFSVPQIRFSIRQRRIIVPFN